MGYFPPELEGSLSFYLHVFFIQQLKDRYTELQKSQQTITKEQNDLGRQLDDVKARKVEINFPEKQN